MHWVISLGNEYVNPNESVAIAETDPSRNKYLNTFELDEAAVLDSSPLLL
jgi:hypothetical protein